MEYTYFDKFKVYSRGYNPNYSIESIFSNGSQLLRNSALNFNICFKYLVISPLFNAIFALSKKNERSGIRRWRFCPILWHFLNILYMFWFVNSFEQNFEILLFSFFIFPQKYISMFEFLRNDYTFFRNL